MKRGVGCGFRVQECLVRTIGEVRAADTIWRPDPRRIEGLLQATEEKGVFGCLDGFVTTFLMAAFFSPGLRENSLEFS